MRSALLRGYDAARERWDITYAWVNNNAESGRYSTRWEFSNLKNSLKSAGSRIISEGDLPQIFQGFKALQRRLAEPERLFVGFGKNASRHNDGAVNSIEPRRTDVG